MPHQPLKLIRASAGSGKTFSLTAHYLVLLFSQPAKYRQILAVTFTNKATAEMKQRILGALRELAGAGTKEPAFRFVIREQYPDLSDEEIRLRASNIYRNILHDYSRFAISTIDGFVQQVIRSFAYELNLDNGYKLELNEQKVKAELVKGLNKRMENDPSLLEWVASLALDRINDGKDWNYERALDDIAGEIFKERYFPFQEAMRVMGDDKGAAFVHLKELLSAETADFMQKVMEKATAAQEVFRQSGILPEELAGKSRHPILKLGKVISGDLGSFPAIAALVGDFSAWPNKSLKNRDKVSALYHAINPLLKELCELYEQRSTQYATFSAINKNAPYLRLMQELADLVSEYRTENRALLISDAQYLLKGITGQDEDNPSFIWEKTGNRFRHFLFDEFQDTSGFQWDNFLPLVRNAVASYEEGSYPDHLVVGDVKQSIYRWRNGDWRILHSKVAADLGPHRVGEVSLDYNRRSSANIIAFNNFLYHTLPALLQKHINAALEESGLPEAAQQDYKNVIQATYAGSAQLPTGQTVPGGEIAVELIPKDAANEEGSTGGALERMAGKLVCLLGEGGYRMKDIGILVKKNSEGEEVIRYLQARQAELTQAAGKTFQLLSGEALRIANDPAVQLLIGTMRLLTAREQEQGVYRVLCARLYFEIHHPGEPSIGLSAADWMKLSKEPLSRLGGLLPVSLCEQYRSFLHLPVTELMEKLIDSYGLGMPECAGYLPYLLALRDLAASFTTVGDEGLNAFLEWWDDEGVGKSLPSPEGQDAVTVMTVHKSKGLEFGAVILPFCNWEFNRHSGFLKRILWVDAEKSGFGNFGSLPVDYLPALRDTVFLPDYFEEMLLNYMDTLNTLYVATTRARNYLCIILPQKGAAAYNLYSAFSELFANGNPYTEEYVLDGAAFTVGEPVKQLSAEKVPEKKIILAAYPVHDHTGLSFTIPYETEPAWFNESQRKGTVLHQILAGSGGITQLGTLIGRHIEEGNLREEERQEIESKVRAIWDHPSISAWIRNADRIVSEKTILSPGGEADRPDKVFILGDTAVLLDFKFGTERESHRRQVLNYKQLLYDMGTYKKVEAHIWYAQTNTLLEV
jgi:ATP-dependent exoDNAse (exonuclease V) beta subunit